MLANIPRLEAKRMLDRAKMGDVNLTVDGWYDLTLLVTGDKELAEKAAKDHIKASRNAGREPE